MSLQQADSLLIARNLSLIVSRYEVERVEAERIQARLFNNPHLSTEWTLYNPFAEKWLDVGRQGHKIFEIQQVFRIAGQRRANLQLLQEKYVMTEAEYEALSRTLRYELHVSFYRYHFLVQAITRIRSQLDLLGTLIEVYSEQYRKGNVSLQKITRLNTTYFTINNEVKSVQQELVMLQETLRLLLGEDRTILPVVTDSAIPQPPVERLEALIQTAAANRPELKQIRSLEAQSRIRYTLARKEAVPDLHAGLLYDQAGSFVNNYTAFTVGISIPLFNRNQGNIQAARIGIQQAEVLLQGERNRIAQEVKSAWQILAIVWEQYNAVGEEFETELDLLSEGLVKNYSKSNISLLEFTDLFEAYNTNILQYNNLKADLIRAYEELVYAVGEDIRY